MIGGQGQVALLLRDDVLGAASFILDALRCRSNLLSSRAHALHDFVGDDAAPSNLAVGAGKARRSSFTTFVRVGRTEFADATTLILCPTVSLVTRIALLDDLRAGDTVCRFADRTVRACACEEK